MGPIEETLARQSYLMKQPLPERIANAPELRQGLGLYLAAYFDLDSERVHGEGFSRIPWTSIVTYAKHFRFDDSQTESLFYFMKEMDSANLQRINDLRGSK